MTAPGTAPTAASEARRDGTVRRHPALSPYLQSIVDTARALFDARASSIFLVTTADDGAAADDGADGAAQLEFVAVSGEGERHLVGQRLPVDTGIAGWVLASGESMVVDDLANDPVFDREAALRTGFVPHTLLAAPIAADERSLGVIEVLDPTSDGRGSLTELELLDLFAVQVATALEVLLEAGRAPAPTPREELAAAIADVFATTSVATIERAGRLLAQLATERSGRPASLP